MKTYSVLFHTSSTGEYQLILKDRTEETSEELVRNLMSEPVIIAGGDFLFTAHIVRIRVKDITDATEVKG